MKSWADLFWILNNKYLLTEYTDPELTMNDAIDGMKILIAGLISRNAMHVDIVKQYEVWLDNLIQQ